MIAAKTFSAQESITNVDTILKYSKLVRKMIKCAVCRGKLICYLPSLAVNIRIKELHTLITIFTQER